jgi:hypothetical protein
MTQEESLKEIVTAAKVISQVIPNSKWYGFGSYFQKKRDFSDIDILIVCATSRESITVREFTKNICNDWPLHLLVMTEDEEAETAFIYRQKCTPLW